MLQSGRSGRQPELAGQEPGGGSRYRQLQLHPEQHRQPLRQHHRAGDHLPPYSAEPREDVLLHPRPHRLQPVPGEREGCQTKGMYRL